MLRWFFRRVSTPFFGKLRVGWAGADKPMWRIETVERLRRPKLAVLLFREAPPPFLVDLGIVKLMAGPISSALLVSDAYDCKLSAPPAGCVPVYWLYCNPVGFFSFCFCMASSDLILARGSNSDGCWDLRSLVPKRL